jgi:hypothetical protein
VQTARGVATPAFDEPFAAWAAFDVQFTGQSTSMPVVRLDRLGLTVVADKGATLPPLGLPRDALIVAGATVLCESRLVVRAATPTGSGATELLIQPSRAGDGAALWAALRARQIQENAAGTQPCTRSPALLQSASSLPVQVGDLRTQSWCDASFGMASREDAQFFACWLDYHFEEVRVRSRMTHAAAQLNEIYVRVADDEVETRFVFAQSDESLIHARMETLCRWIRTEAARQLNMTVEHWLGGALTGPNTAPAQRCAACSTDAGFHLRLCT